MEPRDLRGLALSFFKEAINVSMFRSRRYCSFMESFDHTGCRRFASFSAVSSKVNNFSVFDDFSLRFVGLLFMIKILHRKLIDGK